jgi:hypothetical protein
VRACVFAGCGHSIDPKSTQINFWQPVSQQMCRDEYRRQRSDFATAGSAATAAGDADACAAAPAVVVKTEELDGDNDNAAASPLLSIAVPPRNGITEIADEDLAAAMTAPPVFDRAEDAFLRESVAFAFCLLLCVF